MKNLTAFKDKILSDYRNQRRGFPNEKELQEGCVEAVLMQAIDKSIIWFIENYEAITIETKNAIKSKKGLTKKVKVSEAQ